MIYYLHTDFTDFTDYLKRTCSTTAIYKIKVEGYEIAANIDTVCKEGSI